MREYHLAYSTSYAIVTLTNCTQYDSGHVVGEYDTNGSMLCDSQQFSFCERPSPNESTPWRSSRGRHEAAPAAAVYPQATHCVRENGRKAFTGIGLICLISGFQGSLFNRDSIDITQERE